MAFRDLSRPETELVGSRQLPFSLRIPSELLSSSSHQHSWPSCFRGLKLFYLLGFFRHKVFTQHPALTPELLSTWHASEPQGRA